MLRTSRYIHFDLLRGIATLLVILGHVFIHTQGEYTNSILFSVLVSIHMPLFILLSGYFLGRDLDLSLEGIMKYWKGKIVRLLLPLVLTPFLFDWMRYGFSSEIPLQAFFNEYWFTSALFGLVVLLYLFKAVVEPRSSSSVTLIALAVMWCLIIIGLITIALGQVESNFARQYLAKLSWLLPYLIMGYLMGRIKAVEYWVQDQRVSSIAFVGYIALLWYSYMEPDSHMFTSSLLSLLGLIVCYSLAYHGCNRDIIGSPKETIQPTGWMTKGLVYLGRESLAIYLTHYFFLPYMPWMKDFLESITYRQQVFAWEFALGAFGVVMTLVPTLLMIRIIKCNKYLTLLFYGEMIK